MSHPRWGWGCGVWGVSLCCPSVAWEPVRNSRPLTLQEIPGWFLGQVALVQRRRPKRPGFHPWVGKIPWRRKRQPAPVFSPKESHGQRSLVGYNPWGRKEPDTNEQLTLSLSSLHNISEVTRVMLGCPEHHQHPRRCDSDEG